jgi:tetratricopeptide (TPR) repeat protein
MKRAFSSTLIPLLLILAILTGCKGDPNTRKKKFLEIGNKSYNKGDYKAAALNYKRALQEDNKYPDAYYRLGLTALKTGAYGDAVNNLQRAFTLDPDNADAGAKLAEIYIVALASDPKKARNYLTEVQDVTDKLLKRNPKSYDGLRLSAYLLLQDGKTPEALERYKQANAVKPDEADTILPWAQVLLRDHQDKEGENLLVDFIKKKPHYPGPYDLLYALYARDKRLEDAERILRAKADAIPERPEFRIQLAAHYYINQRRPEMEKELSIVSGAGKDGQGHLLVGDFFTNLKEYDRAQKEFETGIQMGGKNKAAFQMRLVNLYSIEQKYPEANALIEQVVKENPKDNEAIGMRAALKVNSNDLGKIDSAITDLLDMVHRNPENAVIHYQLAKAYMAKAQKTGNKDQVDLARLELETTVKQRPDFAQAKLILAQLQVNAGDYGKAIAMTEEVIAANPANLPAHLIRAVAWAHQREYDKARDALEAILKSSPMQQDARFQLGEVYRMQGNYKAAEETFRQFRKISPGDPRAWSGIAETMLDAKRYKDAEAFLKDELAADPKKEAARLLLARVYSQDKNYDAALTELNTLAKAHPENSDLEASIGDTLRKKGDKQGSITYFRKAVALNPNAPGTMTALAMVLEEYNQAPEARALYEKILKIEPTNVIALNNLAFIKAEEGTDIDGALTMAQKAKQAAPQVDTVSDTLGWIYIKKNLSDDAIRLFSDLCRRQPNNPMFRYHLAQALAQKGDKVKARQELQDMLTRIKNHPDDCEKALPNEVPKYEQRIKDFMPKLA